MSVSDIANQIFDDTVVNELERAMHFAMQGMVAQLIQQGRLPDDFTTYLVVAELSVIGRTLGATMTEDERLAMYDFIQEDGMMIVDAAMRRTVAQLAATTPKAEEPDPE